MSWTWSAAAVWIMMALTVATSSLAGAECIGTEVKLDKGEAVLWCRLPVNASATRQSIIVKHFPTPDTAGEALHCHWPTAEADKPECESSDGFSLVAPLTDQVVAKVPVSRLKDSGAYKVQLYPLGDPPYFTPCDIHRFSDNDEGKHSAVRPTPVVSSTATNCSTPGQDPLIREAPPCVRQSGSVALTAAVLVLQVIIIILMVVSVLYLQNRKDQQRIMDGKRVVQAHRKDDCDFPDQPRTSKSETQRRKSAPKYACNVFGTWSAAAVWIMMTLTVATSSLAGAECIGTEVKLDKGEAVLRCPLPVDVSATHRGIIVKHFPTPDSADEVLFCYWPEEAGKPECESSDSFSVVGQLTDQVVAKVPVSRLMDSGAYQCQLFPPDYQRPFTPCHIHRSSSDSDEGSAVMPTPVVPSLATNGSTPGQDPLIREAPPCVGQSGSIALTAAVLVLQVIIITLLVVNVLYLQNRKNLQKPVTSEEEPMNSLNETDVIPEPTLYPRLPSHCTPDTLQPSSPQSCNLAAVGGLTASAVGQAVLQAPTSGSSPSWSSL